jgi:hypothetical protein
MNLYGIYKRNAIKRAKEVLKMQGYKKMYIGIIEESEA